MYSRTLSKEIIMETKSTLVNLEILTNQVKELFIDSEFEKLSELLSNEDNVAILNTNSSNEDVKIKIISLEQIIEKMKVIQSYRKNGKETVVKNSFQELPKSELIILQSFLSLDSAKHQSDLDEINSELLIRALYPNTHLKTLETYAIEKLLKA